MEAKCRRCDMTCCSGDKCCVCDISDEDVRLLKISGKAKILIFVLRKWKEDKKLQSMKGVVPSDDCFEKQKQEVMTFKANEVANKESWNAVCRHRQSFGGGGGAVYVGQLRRARGAGGA